MEVDLKQALSNYLLALADDELILGHRNSEWCGHAPILEEDIAFANLALDEIGHANLWYQLLAEIDREDPQAYPDRLVFFREPSDFRNARFVELPKGDWAFSMLRQFLFDAFERVRLEALAESSYQPVAGAAEKIRKEEIYHFRHTQAWIKRLGLGTVESQMRLQKALDEIWQFLPGLLAPLPDEHLLVSQGYVPPAGEISAAWEQLVVPFLEDCGLAIPEKTRSSPARAGASSPVSGRDRHSPHFKILVKEMQSVARGEPQAGW